MRKYLTNKNVKKKVIYIIKVKTRSREYYLYQMTFYI